MRGKTWSYHQITSELLESATAPAKPAVAEAS